MSERIDKLLTDGLVAGYAGTMKPEPVRRVGFAGKANDYTDSNNGHYHDEWFADDNGGGQELVRQLKKRATRLYAGGVIPVEELQLLDLTTKDVISQLITGVRELKGKTRLHEPASLELPDGWSYTHTKYSKKKQRDSIYHWL